MRRPSFAITCIGMSRHQIVISVAIRRPSGARCRDERVQCPRRRAPRRTELAESHEPAFEREAEPIGRGLGPRRQPRVVGLGQEDEAPVVAEVERQQLGVTVQPQSADDQPLEVPGEEVGQVERARLLVCERGEGCAAGVDLVAVGAFQACDALGLEHASSMPPVPQSAYATKIRS